jgi:hypothetical protein
MHGQRAVAGDGQVGLAEEGGVGFVLGRVGEDVGRGVGERVLRAVREHDHDLLSVAHENRRAAAAVQFDPVQDQRHRRFILAVDDNLPIRQPAAQRVRSPPAVIVAVLPSTLTPAPSTAIVSPFRVSTTPTLLSVAAATVCGALSCASVAATGAASRRGGGRRGGVIRCACRRDALGGGGRRCNAGVVAGGARRQRKDE